ncbi:uncharacterized protein DSM5745_09486 [Aspergillus mulundensis]|uniref:F-box domain-containing protein n=1 Tax=Aspergillus mulundensis TaxID=1810919 RepID=A0A3D8QVE4_9EURO|nr:hypothetical protein DSM5745_09486 [Aspergillus mulundensis]RDW65747.1 hypothetical protein DSM5745_09486 [Aspergillus mulundensis]
MQTTTHPSKKRPMDASEPPSAKPKKARQLEPTAALCTLPPEIVGTIASNLDVKALKSLRLANHYLHDSTYHHFGAAVYFTQTTDLTSGSLIDLDELSKDTRLSHHVKQLTLTFNPNHRIHHFGTGTEWRRVAPRAGRRKCEAPLVSDQESIKDWQDAIARLINCTSFKVYETPEVRHWSTVRTTPEWSREDNHDNMPEPDPRLENGESFSYGLDHTDAYMVLINVIRGASIPVERFVLLPPYLDMDLVDTAHLRDPAFRAAWSNLRELEIDPGSWRMAGDRERYVSGLIGLASNLDALTLHMDGCLGILRRLATDTSHTFKLKSLGLCGRAYLGSGRSLAKFICRHRATLQRLNLEHIALLDGGVGYLLNTLNSAQGLSALRSLCLKGLEEGTGQTVGKRLSFPVFRALVDWVDQDTGVHFRHKYQPRSYGVAATSTIELEGQAPHVGVALRDLEAKARVQ